MGARNPGTFPMTPRLEPAKPHHLAAIMGLETAGFEPGIAEDESVFQKRLAHFPRGFFVMVDTDTHTVVGTSTTEIWKGPTPLIPGQFTLGHDLSQYHDATGDELYLASMTVSPALRGRGLGRVLFLSTLTAMVVAFPKLKRVTLLVNETWVTARGIYQKAGFEDLSYFQDFFQPRGKPPQGAWVMGKFLAGW